MYILVPTLAHLQTRFFNIKSCGKNITGILRKSV